MFFVYVDITNDGRKIPAIQYLLLLYGFDGLVKYHFELNVFDRKRTKA